MASFLMIFAFMAAVALFDAALRWESDSTNIRRAALVAERKMGDLRAWAEDYFSTHSFDDPLGWSSQVGGPTQYPESPGFDITVAAESAQYLTPNPNRPLPPDGFYSPASHFFTPPPPPGDNPQRHQLWLTYPFSRDLSSSMRRVEITVNYGNGGAREYKLMTVISDPIARPRATSPGRFPREPVLVTGPGSIAAGAFAEYAVEVHLPNGQPITDVTALWTIEPVSTGAATLLPLDSSGRSIRVTRDSLLTPAGAGAELILAAKVRYRGKEIVGYSTPITMP